MKTHELHSLLTRHPELPVRLRLPQGGLVPVSFHITELGRVHKRFIDCGGQQHESMTSQFQAWVGGDDDHRLRAGTVAAIMDKAAAAFGDDDLPVEIEYQDRVISQYPLTGAARTDDALELHLGEKHTDCLAKELCGVPAASGSEEPCGNEESANPCCAGSGGCR